MLWVVRLIGAQSMLFLVLVHCSPVPNSWTFLATFHSRHDRYVRNLVLGIEKLDTRFFCRSFRPQNLPQNLEFLRQEHSSFVSVRLFEILFKYLPSLKTISRRVTRYCVRIR